MAFDFKLKLEAILEFEVWLSSIRHGERPTVQGYFSKIDLNSNNDKSLAADGAVGTVAVQALASVTLYLTIHITSHV